jgi:hypothetical protein
LPRSFRYPTKTTRHFYRLSSDYERNPELQSRSEIRSAILLEYFESNNFPPRLASGASTGRAEIIEENSLSLGKFGLEKSVRANAKNLPSSVPGHKGRGGALRVENHSHEHHGS